MSDQSWNPANYDENARFVSDLGIAVLELLAPKCGERILDLGCGDGALTAKLLESGCNVVGVDSSAPMIAAARARGVDAQVMGAESLPFSAEFDAVVSNAALHWMQNPNAVIAGVSRALKQGGRFVGEFGGYGNVATIVAAVHAALSIRQLTVPSPWFFPKPDEYRRLLEDGGFTVRSVELISRPTALPGDVGAWLETFAQPYLSALHGGERGAFVSEVVASLRPLIRDAGGKWQADYVRLRFAAVK